MILLATFNNEMDAQLLESQLKEAGIDSKVEAPEGADTYRVLVFEDDLEEAKEIIESQTDDDDDIFPSLSEDDIDLDDFEDL